MARNPLTDGEPFSVAQLNAIKHAHDSEGVVSGGDLSTGAGNFDVDVASGTVALNGSRVSVSSTTKTHDTSDTNDRIDLLSVNSADTVSITKGTEDTTSANGDQPVAPDIPTDEVLLGAIHVRGGASEILSGDILDKYQVTVREIEDLTTASTDSSKFYGPDGSGGVASQSPPGSTPAWTEDGNSPLTGSGSQAHTFSLSSSYDAVKIFIESYENTSGSGQTLDLRVNGISTTDYTGLFHSAGTSSGSEWNLTRDGSFPNGGELTGFVHIMGTAGNVISLGVGIGSEGAFNDIIIQGTLTGHSGAISSLEFRGGAGNTSITATVFGWNS